MTKSLCSLLKRVKSIIILFAHQGREWVSFQGRLKTLLILTTKKEYIITILTIAYQLLSFHTIIINDEARSKEVACPRT